MAKGNGPIITIDLSSHSTEWNGQLRVYQTISNLQSHVDFRFLYRREWIQIKSSKKLWQCFRASMRNLLGIFELYCHRLAMTWRKINISFEFDTQLTCHSFTATHSITHTLNELNLPLIYFTTHSLFTHSLYNISWFTQFALNHSFNLPLKLELRISWRPKELMFVFRLSISLQCHTKLETIRCSLPVHMLWDNKLISMLSSAKFLASIVSSLPCIKRDR